MDCSLALDGLDAVQIQRGRAEQPNPAADQLRHDVQHHLVDQPAMPSSDIDALENLVASVLEHAA